MKHPILATLAVLGAVTAAQAADITPTRVGPVSQYGQLMAGKNSQNKGQIYGSCEGIKDGAEVQVRGMSLYWSLMDEALEFWSEEGVTSMVNDMKIQIVRAAMATGKEDWTKGKYIGYEVQPEVQTNFMKAVVEAAIKQDIYVIIDWHSHEANTQTQNAVKFFGEMAQEYGKYDNVIFEVFNEPKKVEWNVIKTYADAVVAEIRKYSDNLILVGTPEWDQFPNRAIGSGNAPRQPVLGLRRRPCHRGDECGPLRIRKRMGRHDLRRKRQCRGRQRRLAKLDERKQALVGQLVGFQDSRRFRRVLGSRNQDFAAVQRLRNPREELPRLQRRQLHPLPHERPGIKFFANADLASEPLLAGGCREKFFVRTGHRRRDRP